jgi:hypothetical protein
VLHLLVCFCLFFKKCSKYFFGGHQIVAPTPNTPPPPPPPRVRIYDKVAVLIFLLIFAILVCCKNPMKISDTTLSIQYIFRDNTGNALTINSTISNLYIFFNLSYFCLVSMMNPFCFELEFKMERIFSSSRHRR